MLKKILSLLCAATILTLWTATVFAQLDLVADQYLDVYTGNGLGSAKISNLTYNGGDLFRDLVVTNDSWGGHVCVSKSKKSFLHENIT